MLATPIVDLLDRRLQPHLDQAQDVPVAHATRHRLHELGVRDLIEVGLSGGNCTH
jgi:hypothetical protein